MSLKSEMLTSEEFASLLTVGNTSAVVDPPAAIPTAHSAKLIALGYMADLSGRLRMTTPGRQRIREGFDFPPTETVVILQVSESFDRREHRE
jgi:hypothetical protein